MKKSILIILLAFALVITFSCPWYGTYAFADDGVEGHEDEVSRSSSGTCGANLTWTLDDNGVLTITGEGKMNFFSNIHLPPWYSDREAIVKIVLKSGVTEIGQYAFSNCSNLTSVTIPSSVTSIGDTAFSGCTSLPGITIPTGVTSIGTNAFSNCSSLASVSLPNSVTSIGSGAFSGCSSLTRITIPSRITSIENGMFYGCTGLASVSLPVNLTNIGSRVFYGCSSLKSITIPSNVTAIGEYAFCECSSLTSITIPQGVLKIASFTFSRCSSLAKVTIPGSVTEIGSNAFFYCSGLKSIAIPNNVTSIKDSAFRLCTSLTSVTIPESVTSIESGTFSECSSLTSITIPGGVTSIGASAFYGCSSLTSIRNPENVVSIGGSAFSGCSNLASINIPEGVTTIGYATFERCSSLTSIILPEGVTAIGSYAFNNCSNLVNVNIPEGVTRIEEYTFGGCTNLASITIPDGVTSIGTSAFVYCRSLTGIMIPESVTSIGGFAFLDCTSLESIAIPEGVTSIEGSTFASCSNLTSITIPEGVTSIGDKAFSDCYHLTSITIPGSVTSIGSQAFSDCGGLTSIVIPEGVTSIGERAFYDCGRLTSITIPESLTSIGAEAFLYCNNVQYIFYGGTEEQWAALRNRPSKGIVHYESTDHTCAYVEDIMATCTEDGFATWHCIYCDYSDHANDDKVIPAFGHDWAEPEYTWSDDNSSVTAARVCNNDAAHEETETVNTIAEVTKPATCEEGGETTYTASFTNEAFTQQVKTVENISATGHAWGNWVLITKPGCETEGVEIRVCANDSSHIETRAVAAIGHDWGDWVVTTEPGCETEGVETRVCANDDSHVETRAIAALGHNWDEGVVIEEPTYFDEGLILYTCKNDPSHTYTAVLPKLDRPDEPVILRISGKNRAATAIEAANHLKEKNRIEKFDNVVIASGTGFADALSASYLAYKKDGPILLVDNSSISTVADFVNDNLASGGKVFIVGGKGAVPYDVDEKIIAANGAGSVVRLAGKNRYITNILVLDEAGVEGEDLLVASGSGFADALSASAAKKPIFLVGASLSEEQVTYLNSHAASLSSSYYVIGGNGAVSQEIESTLDDYGSVKRLKGSNRYATSVAVADEFFPGNVDTVVIANGMNFPDGLSGGPVAAEYDAPLILVTDKDYSHAVQQFAQKNAFHLVIMGGKGVISDYTASMIAYDPQ